MESNVLEEESKLLPLSLAKALAQELESSNALVLELESSNKLLLELELSNVDDGSQNRLPPASSELLIIGRPVVGLMP